MGHGISQYSTLFGWTVFFDCLLSERARRWHVLCWVEMKAAYIFEHVLRSDQKLQYMTASILFLLRQRWESYSLCSISEAGDAVQDLFGLIIIITEGKFITGLVLARN